MHGEERFHGGGSLNLGALRREKAELVALNSLSGMTYGRLRDLLTLYGSPGGAWEALIVGEQALALKGSLNQEARDLDPVRLLGEVERGGTAVMVRGEPEYPNLLENITDPPFLLYYRGKPPSQHAPSVAVVGSRKASGYGLEVARWLSSGLVGEGFNVVSGAAWGIDTAAHRGALDKGGQTTAVLGCGVDVAYPRSNRALLQEIAESGCLISEFPPGTPPLKGNFPMRTRLIAGMARATVVVEAGSKSGALITAEFALSEGREVMAVPGPVFSPSSKGTNELIRNGATPVTCPDDVVEALGMKMGTKCFQAESGPHLTERERLLLDALAAGEADAEHLSRSLGTTVTETVVMLSSMEVLGLVARGPGGLYRYRPPGGSRGY